MIEVARAVAGSPVVHIAVIVLVVASLCLRIRRRLAWRLPAGLSSASALAFRQWDRRLRARLGGWAVPAAGAMTVVISVVLVLLLTDTPAARPGLGYGVLLALGALPGVVAVTVAIVRVVRPHRSRRGLSEAELDVETLADRRGIIRTVASPRFTRVRSVGEIAGALGLLLLGASGTDPASLVAPIALASQAFVGHAEAGRQGRLEDMASGMLAAEEDDERAAESAAAEEA